MRKKLLLALLTLAMAGCGGSGGDNSPNPGSDVIINGIVVNSDVSGKVCYDRNNNKVCDPGEPYSAIKNDGAFTLNGTEADSVSSPIIAELSGNAQTSNIFSAANNVTVLETLPGKRVISPITTLIKAKLDSNPLLSADAVDAEVKSDLGINSNIDLFDPAGAKSVSTINGKVYGVISLFVEALNQLGIQFSSGLMSLIYSEINAQLSTIMNNDPDDIVNNSMTGKTKDDLEDEINNISSKAMPDVYTAAEMANRGASLYMFHYNDNDGYNFCLFKFNANTLKIYCNGGEKHSNGRLILPTETNYSNYESFPLIINNGAAAFKSDDGVTIFYNFTEIDAGGKTIKASPWHSEQPVTFSNGSIVYKVSVSTDLKGWWIGDPFTDVVNSQLYTFDYTAADAIRLQWDENY